MLTTIDRDGKIALGLDVLHQLGVHPGDEVVLEQRNGEWTITAKNAETGLCYENNVLVHRGTMLPIASDEAELLEDTGAIRVEARETQSVTAQVISVPRRSISSGTED